MVIDKKYAGAAVLAHVSGSMTPSSPTGGGTFTVDDATGYPSTGAFVVVIDRGLATEEKILVASRVTTTFTVSSRGYDGTTGQSHSASASCELALDAVAINLVVDHIDGVEADPHSTKLLNTTRHDIAARHTFGAAYGTPATPQAIVANQAGSAGSGSGPSKDDHVHAGPVTATAVSVGTANSAGSGTNLSLANHVHALGNGSINATALFGSQVVPATALVNDSVTATQLAADSVGASELANGAVAVAADIVDAIITQAKIALEDPTSYAPTAANFGDSGGGAVTMGTGGTTYGYYFKFGRLVVFLCGFSMAADGNVPSGTAIRIPAPFTQRALTTMRGFVAARARLSSPETYASGTGVIQAGNNYGENIATAGASAQWDATVPWNWGTPGSGAATLDAVGIMVSTT